MKDMASLVLIPRRFHQGKGQVSFLFTLTNACLHSGVFVYKFRCFIFI